MIDLMIYAVGYEARARHAPSNTSYKHSLAIVFESFQGLEFDSNLREARVNNAVEVSEQSASQRISELIARLIEDSEASLLVVAVDVSSMTRSLMAKVLLTILPLVKDHALSIQIHYSEGEYISPPEVPASAFDLHPIEGFEGWSVFPERPLSLILGLGYEEDQAAAAVEYLDPSLIRAFFPEGRDKRFVSDVWSANDSLKRLVEDDHFLPYHPEEPARLYTEMLALVETLSKQSRVVIVTGGPKIFSALAMLIQFEAGSEVSLWQISSHKYSEPRDVSPAGPISVFEFHSNSVRQ
jgi:hypothetical protein